MKIFEFKMADGRHIENRFLVITQQPIVGFHLKFCPGKQKSMTCTELVLKIMDAGYCLYVHIFMKNIKSMEVT